MDINRKTLLVIGFVRNICKIIGIELLPEDITQLFILWLCFGDTFDEALTHKSIKIDSIQDDKYGSYQKINLEGYRDFMDHATAICERIVEKGLRAKWTFKFERAPNYTFLLVGIVDDEMAVNSKGEMTDFTEPEYEGYGLFLQNMFKYHGADDDHSYDYGDQFHFEDDHLVTMELDLTQEKNEHGILSFIMHSKVNGGIDISQYSNILYDDIDINKKWRAAIAICHSNDATSLLPVD